MEIFHRPPRYERFQEWKRQAGQRVRPLSGPADGHPCSGLQRFKRGLDGCLQAPAGYFREVATVRGHSNEAVLERGPSSPFHVVCQPNTPSLPDNTMDEFESYQASGPERSRLRVEEDRRDCFRSGVDIHDGDNSGHLAIRSLGSALGNEVSSRARPPRLGVGPPTTDRQRLKRAAVPGTCGSLPSSDHRDTASTTCSVTRQVFDKKRGVRPAGTTPRTRAAPRKVLKAYRSIDRPHSERGGSGLSPSTHDS